jgi:acyl-homoserine-lactone acylase
MRRATVLAAALAAVTAGLGVARAPATDSSAYRAEIRRTEYGIPHVLADDWGSIGFGVGYAFAEDNLCVMADTFVTVNARRSQWFGPEGTYRSEANGVVPTNLKSDFFYQRINDSGIIEQLLDGRHPLSGRPVPPRVREVVDGWAAGWNAYLRDIGSVDAIPDPACRGAQWVQPVTATDLYRRFYQLSLFASAGALLPAIVDATPPAPGAPASSTAAPAQPDLSLLPSVENLRLGSNAYALGPAATRHGGTMLLGNPHFPWRGPERFYEMHLTIPGELNVFGGALFGSPAVLIGHNDHLAWSHTVSVPYRFTPYELKLVPGRPTSYFHDGGIKQMTSTTVTVPVRKADGATEPRTHTFWDSHLGPVLHFPGALMPWTPALAYTMVDANATNLRTLEHFMRMATAKSTYEAEHILREVQGIPWVNTLVADDRGDAFYADISVVPHITDEQLTLCTVPLGWVLRQLARLPVLDGTRKGCEPGRDPDAVAPGIYGGSALPKQHRHDYVANSNDSFWLSNADEPLEGHPWVMGNERLPRSLRTRLGIRQIEQRLDGSDGRGAPKFTLEMLQDTVFGNRHYAGELLRDDLVRMCERTPVAVIDSGQLVRLDEACEVLRGWDVRVDRDSRGAHLFREFLKAAPGDATLFLVAFDPEDPVNTPRRLNTLNPQVLQALGTAVARLEATGIPLGARLGEVQQAVRNDDHIEIHGGSDEGIFNYVQADWDPRDGRLYPDTVYGSSFVITAEFAPDQPVRSASILTYSLSTNAASPHFGDQTRLYSDKQWVPTRFTEDAIAASPALRRYAVTG